MIVNKLIPNKFSIMNNDSWVIKIHIFIFDIRRNLIDKRDYRQLKFFTNIFYFFTWLLITTFLRVSTEIIFLASYKNCIQQVEENYDSFKIHRKFYFMYIRTYA